jgi:hypothetical protein
MTMPMLTEDFATDYTEDENSAISEAYDAIGLLKKAIPRMPLLAKRVMLTELAMRISLILEEKI